MDSLRVSDDGTHGHVRASSISVCPFKGLKSWLDVLVSQATVSVTGFEEGQDPVPSEKEEMLKDIRKEIPISEREI